MFSLFKDVIIIEPFATEVTKHFSCCLHLSDVLIQSNKEQPEVFQVST